jgi:hypothetical protein
MKVCVAVMSKEQDFPFLIFHFSFANSIWKCNELMLSDFAPGRDV